MAMNLRLDSAHEELLESLAKEERRTRVEAVELAIEERAAKAVESARTRAIFERIMDEDTDLVDVRSKRLSIWTQRQAPVEGRHEGVSRAQPVGLENHRRPRR